MRWSRAQGAAANGASSAGASLTAAEGALDDGVAEQDSGLGRDMLAAALREARQQAKQVGDGRRSATVLLRGVASSGRRWWGVGR